MPQYTPYTLGGPLATIKKRNLPKRNMPMKRKWPASFAVPMQISTPTTGRGSRRRTSRSGYRGSYSGPYRALTNGSRHTNPVYPRPELKVIDLNEAMAAPSATVTPVNITNVGTAIFLNAIAQGASTSARIGARIAVKSCAYRYEVQLQAAATASVSGRVILVWDKQSNGGALPSWSDIFSVANYLAFMNVGNTERFVILRNQQFSLSPQGDQSLFFEGYCKINMETVWQSAASGPVAPTSGGLLALWISDQATAANQPQIAGVWRTRFVDC